MITRWRIPPESSCGYARTRRAVDADELEQVAGAVERVALRDALVRLHHVDELRADAHHRVEAFIALWKTIETFRQRNCRSSSLLLPVDLLAAEEDAAADDRRGRPQDLHDRVRDRALAAARLAGQSRRSRRRGSSRSTPSTARTGALTAVLDVQLPHLDQHLSVPTRASARSRGVQSRRRSCRAPAGARSGRPRTAARR